MRYLYKRALNVFTVLAVFLTQIPPVQAESDKVVSLHSGIEATPDYKTPIINVDIDSLDGTMPSKIAPNEFTVRKERKVNAEKKEVVTETVMESVEEVPSEDTGISSNELDLLSRIVEAEAKGEPYAGKVAVAEVILNRVNSSEFPNTITDVVYQSGQFSPVTDGSINNKASQDSKNAVNEALQGSSNIGNALFFWNPSIATSRWLDSKETVTTIGNHEFKR